MAPRLLLPVISSRNVPVAVSPPVPAVSGNGMNEMVLSRYTLSGGFRPAYSELSSEFGGWTVGSQIRFIKLCSERQARGLPLMIEGYFLTRVNTLSVAPFLRPRRLANGLSRAMSRFTTWLIS